MLISAASIKLILDLLMSFLASNTEVMGEILRELSGKSELVHQRANACCLTGNSTTDMI